VLAGILPTLTAVSDGDAVAVAHECCSSPVADAASPLGSETVGSQTAWLPVPLRSSLRATANDASRSRPLQIVVDRAQPHPAPARDLSLPQRQPSPNSNLNRRTSFVFRMDILLAGTLFSSLIEFLCRVIVQRRYRLLRLACGKHSAPS
jgi:hypothetical protein